MFSQNSLSGGFEIGKYDLNSSQPTLINWTRQSIFDGPINPVVKCIELKSIYLNNSFVIGQHEKVFIGSENGFLLTIDKDGLIKKLFKSEKPVGVPVIGENGVLFCTYGSYESEGHKLNLVNFDGDLIWSCDIGSQAIHQPVIGDDGSIYITTERGSLYSISTDGKIKWEYKKPFMHWSAPLISKNKIIYTGTSDQRISALDYDGKEMWSLEIGQGREQNMLIDSEYTLYMNIFNNGQGRLLSIKDNKIKWSFCPKIGNITTSPALSKNKKLYVGANFFRLIAINIDGEQEWETKVNGFVKYPPIIGNDGTIFVSTYNSIDGFAYSWITAISKDGLKNWEVEFKGDTTCPVLSNNSIKIISFDHKTKQCSLNIIS